jgi:hypothetical protein
VEWQLLEQDFLAGCSYDEEINPILLTAQLKGNNGHFPVSKR